MIGAASVGKRRIENPAPARSPRAKRAKIADLFCGAGSLSMGANDALIELGYKPEFVAVNHWDVATQTYARNHPGARVHCVTLDVASPMQLVPKGRLDLLMAGIECTFFSRARGGKPVNDQQRMSAWHVVRWCTELRVKRLLLENVPEFVRWGPVDPRSGRPIKSREGEYFRAWWASMQAIGFTLEMRVINCADFGDATTRERLFIMGRSDGKPIVWPKPSHAKRSSLFGEAPWRTAREIIDWGIKGKSIFTRKKALRPATLRRILAGIVKFGWPEPFIVVLRQHMAAQGLDVPLPSMTAGGTHLALAQPVVFQMNQSKDRARGINSVDDPLGTITASGTDLGLVEPILVNMKGRSTASSIADPAPTVTAHARHLAVAEPLIMSQHGERRCHPVDSPVPTVTAVPRVGLVEPFIIGTRQMEGGGPAPRSVESPVPTITTGTSQFALVEPFIFANRTNNIAKSVGEPTPTICTGGNLAVVEPFILNRHGENGGTRAHSVDEPAPTADCRGAGYLVEPFVLSNQGGGAPRSVSEPVPGIVNKIGHALIAPYYGSGSGESCSSVESPLPTCTTLARFGLVVPVTHTQDGSGRSRSVDDPMPTITGAARGELAFIAAAFGERPGQDPRVHSVDEPAPTICASGRVNLVQGDPSYDILFRMLEPHELAAAMSISEPGRPYHFSGNKTEVVRQIGQAVPRRTGRALALELMRHD